MLNILICDDERDIRNALAIYLRAEGYGIYEAADGRQALEVLGRERIELVLMDIMMPDMDGVTATAKYARARTCPLSSCRQRGRTWIRYWV